MRNLSSNERGILANVDIGLNENGQMVMDDHRIVDAPEGESPYSALHRKPPGMPPNDIHAQMEQHILSASHPGETIEEYTRFLKELAAKYVSGGSTSMSLNRGGFNRKGCWSGGTGKAYGRDVVSEVFKTVRLSLDEKELLERIAAMPDSTERIARSGDDVVDLLQDILDKLEAEMDGGDAVQQEANGRLRTILLNIIATRQRYANEVDDEDTDDNMSDDFASAYSEVSPAFATMAVRQPQRPQSDAEAEKLVDQLYHRKRYSAAS